MEKIILTIDNKEMQHGFVNQDERIHIVFHISKAFEALIEKNSFLLIVIFRNSLNELSLLKNIRCLTSIPIIVFAEKYNAAEMVAVIEAGADEYLLWPGTIREALASCYSMIRRYTVFDKQKVNHISKNVILLENVLIDRNLCKMYVYGKELQMAPHEFDMFYLLASYLERIFTFEQLFIQVWGNERVSTENSIHSCVRRIRRKMETIQECPYSIENMRGVGYYLHLTRKKKAALPWR